MKVLLKLNDVKKATTLSRSAIYQQMAKGTFPRPIKLINRGCAWLEEDVDNWINDKILKSKNGGSHE